MNDALSVRVYAAELNQYDFLENSKGIAATAFSEFPHSIILKNKEDVAVSSTDYKCTLGQTGTYCDQLNLS